jgi:hypothetical protein
MAFLENDYQNLRQRVARYQEVLQNTARYRDMWQSELKAAIISQLDEAIKAVNLTAKIEQRAEIQNLEAIVLNLGVGQSGLGEPIGDSMRRDLIKQNGSLVYQQLFNGKILVLVNYPFIEKYGQPQPPKTIAIYRPDEIKAPFVMRHIETLLAEVTNWEDYDDDAPESNQRIGFKLNFDPKPAEKPA